MRIRTVSDTTAQLTRYGFVNAYLVREEDGLTLVDTTMNAAEQILAAASEPIRRIALTHGHGDQRALEPHLLLVGHGPPVRGPIS